jgi:hypothetical protein
MPPGHVLWTIISAYSLRHQDHMEDNLLGLKREELNRYTSENEERKKE